VKSAPLTLNRFRQRRPNQQPSASRVVKRFPLVALFLRQPLKAVLGLFDFLLDTSNFFAEESRASSHAISMFGEIHFRDLSIGERFIRHNFSISLAVAPYH